MLAAEPSGPPNTRRRQVAIAIGMLLCSAPLTASADPTEFSCGLAGEESSTKTSMGACSRYGLTSVSSGAMAVGVSGSASSTGSSANSTVVGVWGHGSAINGTNMSGIGLYGEASASMPNGRATGVAALARGTYTSTAVSASASSSSYNTTFEGSATGGNVATGISMLASGATSNYGAQIVAQNGTTNTALQVSANGNTGSTNVGIHAMAFGGTKAIPVYVDSDSGTANPQLVLHEKANDFARLQFDNTSTTSVFHVAAKPQSTAATSFLNVWFTGTGNVASFRGDGAFNITTLGAYTSNALCASTSSGPAYIGRCSSSARYKKDIDNLELGMEVVSKLRPVTFTSTSTGERDFGFIAEEAAKIDPLLATYDDQGRPESVRYYQLTAVLTNAIQHQQSVLREQGDALSKQRREVESLRTEVARGTAASERLGSVVEDQRRLIERQARLIDRLEEHLVANAHR